MDQLINFIRHTFTQAHKSTAVIALSGGIDSAVSFALTVKALGPDHIHAFHLPAKNSNPIHLKDCQILTSTLELPTSNFHLINIGSIIQKSWHIINKNSEYRIENNEASDAETSAFQHGRISKEPQATEEELSTAKASFESIAQTNKLRLANLAARIRMTVIYDQAKKYDALVVGTENYSEHLLGYYTRFGDEASDLEPIRHLYKTEVIELAKKLQLPESIITKPPSADLWRGQTDAGELGFTYQQADPILKLIDAHQSAEQIVQASHNPDLVKLVIAQVNAASFKHQVPYLI